MKIAVVGGGIFGVTIANKLSHEHNVSIFEKNRDILSSASGINQYRIHRGFHYPRSDETALSAKNAEKSFKQEYLDSVINNVEHYYCIAKKDSLTTGNNYKKFCIKNGLEFSESELDILNNDQIDLCVRVEEVLIDIEKLRKICWKKLEKNQINVITNNEITLNGLESFDQIIIATYANLNKILTKYPQFQHNYQFEICEKPIVTLPQCFQKKSIVIMDGPFMCVDPFGNTDKFVLGNVVHAIHQTNIGKFPQINKKFLGLLNSGIIKNPTITKFDSFINSATKFMPEIKKAKHIGSMYTIRTVLPNIEKTDARPTMVSRLNKKIISIFSGKIGNCVEAAEKTSKLIDDI